jgi:hypothetical protein
MTMKRRGRLFLLAALVCCCLCGGAFAQTGGGAPPAQRSGARAVENVAAPQGWKRYEIHYVGGSVLSVVLPGQPEESNDKIPMGTLPPATQHIFTSSDDKGVYVVGYLEGLPAQVTGDPTVRANFFDGLWKGFAEGLSAELKKNKLAFEVTAKPLRQLRVSGHQAQVQDFDVGKFPGSARAVRAGGHSYLVVYISLAETVTDEGTSFLDSFDIRSKR